MSKKDVLLFLQENQTEYVSGEVICRRLGITRAAVWKAVAALRKEGYCIEARPSQGYRLISVPDALTKDAIFSFPFSLDRENLTVLDSVDSTNTYLKRLALTNGAGNLVAVADHQSAGRGRMGRSFESPAGKGVYLSVLLRPCITPVQALPATGLCAVAVRRAIQKVCGIDCGIKWTNDLVCEGKKICGILTEMALESESGRVQHMIVGVGVNVHHTKEDFSPEVAALASSLDLACGKTVSRAQLTAAVVEELLKLPSLLESAGSIGDYVADYRAHCVTLGKDARLMWREGAEKVFALDIDDEFGLVVRHVDGTEETIRSGEVSVRGLYGYTE